MNDNTKINSNSKNKKLYDYIIFSKQFLLIILFTMISLGIIQWTLFFTDTISVAGFYYSDNSWKSWVSLSLSSIGAATSPIGLLLINRTNKRFFYFSLTTALLLSINGFVSGIFFEGIKWIFVGSTLLVHAVLWNMPSLEIKIKNFKWYIMLSLFITIFISLVLFGQFGVKKIPEDSFFYNTSPILDPLQSGFTITGNILMMFKIIQSRIIYGFGNILTILMFGQRLFIQHDIGSLSLFVNGIFYLIITIAGYLKLKDSFIEQKKSK